MSALVQPSGNSKDINGLDNEGNGNGDILAAEEIDFSNNNLIDPLELKFIFPVAYTLKRHLMFLDRAECVRYTLTKHALEFIQLLVLILRLVGINWGSITYNKFITVLSYFQLQSYASDSAGGEVAIYIISLAVVLVVILCFVVIQKTFSETKKRKIIKVRPHLPVTAFLSLSIYYILCPSITIYPSISIPFLSIHRYIVIIISLFSISKRVS